MRIVGIPVNRKVQGCARGLTGTPGVSYFRGATSIQESPTRR